MQVKLVYDRKHYFGLGPITKPKPKLADTFGRYFNWYRNRYRNQYRNWYRITYIETIF